jgi:hypothetical protein
LSPVGGSISESAGGIASVLGRNGVTITFSPVRRRAAANASAASGNAARWDTSGSRDTTPLAAR